jgi:hypothetical protein
MDTEKENNVTFLQFSTVFLSKLHETL